MPIFFEINGHRPFIREFVSTLTGINGYQLYYAAVHLSFVKGLPQNIFLQNLDGRKLLLLCASNCTVIMPFWTFHSRVCIRFLLIVVLALPENINNEISLLTQTVFFSNPYKMCEQEAMFQRPICFNIRRGIFSFSVVLNAFIVLNRDIKLEHECTGW